MRVCKNIITSITSAVALALVITACSASSTNTLPIAKIATETDAIATSMASAVSMLKNTKTLTPAEISKITTDLSLVQSAASAIAQEALACTTSSSTTVTATSTTVSSPISCSSTTAGSTQVQQIVTAFNDALGGLANSSLLPPNVAAIIDAINVVLPPIEAAVGIMGVSPQPVMKLASGYDFTPATAQLFLDEQAAAFRSK